MVKPSTVKPAEPEIPEKLLHFIAEHMAIEQAELMPSALLMEDLHLDEIDLAELLMRAEEELGATEFDDAEWEECRTVADFVKLIEAHTPRRSSKTPRKG
jgi:acyl carrier protein